MADNRLPPLRLNSALSVRSDKTNEDSQVSQNSRERRRQRILNQKQILKTEVQQSEAPSSPHEDEIMTTRKKNRRGRSAPQNSSHTNMAYNSGDEKKVVTDLPPLESSRKSLQSKRKASRQTNNFKIQAMPNNYILEGLEEDIIEMGEENDKKLGRSKETLDRSERRGSEASMNTLNPRSVPTDKFYLELEKKFAIQNKELYEKKEQERLRQEFQWQLKQKQKEEQRYQISTPKTALSTHKLLRKIFLFLQGINVGFQLWQIILIFFNSSSQFVKNTTKTNVNSFSAAEISNTIIFFEKLTLPVHSLSYFFLTICIVDTIDRVDFTKMNLVYFVKCLSFQNQFWSIVFYYIALVASLSLIFVDEPVYLLNYLRGAANVSNSTSSLFTTTINKVNSKYFNFCFNSSKIMFIFLFSRMLKFGNTLVL